MLEKEKRDGKAGRIARSLMRMDLVILDELGYLPFSQAGGALLFHLALKTLRTYQCDHHHESEFLGVVQRIWRQQNDNGAS